MLIIKFKKLAFLLIISGLLLSESIFAGSMGVSISPQKFDITVFPGGSETIQIRLRNDSNRLLPMSGSVAPFDAEEGTGQMTFDESGPTEWANFRERSFVMRPDQEARVDLDIEVPTDAKPGGYYLFAYFEPRISSYGGDTGPRVVPVIGVPILISTADLSLEDAEPKEPEIVEFTMDESARSRFLERQLARLPIAFAVDEPAFYVTRRMPDLFSVTVKNNDSYHINPKGTLTIYESGKEVAKGDFEGETILPGRSRSFDVSVVGDMSVLEETGTYTAEVDLNAGSSVRGEVISANKSVSFVNIPFHFWIAVFFLAGLILALRKRIKTALTYALEFTG